MKSTNPIKPCAGGAGKQTFWRAGFILMLFATAGAAFALDGEAMLNMTCEQCNFGPRVPGTPPHEECRKWIVKKIAGLGMVVKEEPFTAHLALSGKTAPACNLWGLPAEDGPTSPALLLSAHWDTRPWADHDPSGSNPPMLGANDGAAAVAVVLELAKSLRSTPLAPHLAIAFWDAEDAGVSGNDDSWAVGSRYAAKHPPAWVGRIRLGINLDMVAGEDLKLYPERYSRESAGAVVSELWRLGGRMSPGIFDSSEERTVIDDHLPWVRRGVPFIDLVGIDYRYWHTAGDTPARCSARTMESVATVLREYLLRGGWRKN